MVSLPKLFVSVSGGQSSGFMAYKLATEYRDKYEMVFGFSNTGEENEETLVFANHCDKAWQLNLVWLEAVVRFKERRSSGHKIVDFLSAARSGQPYEDVIKKYGIPNKPYPHCTRELKLNPMRSYLDSIGWKTGTFVSAVGIRADEPRRLSNLAEKKGIVYPLAHWFPITKPEVNDWWSTQSFRLALADYQGNCKWCWKKSTPKLIQIAQESPQFFDFPERMEREHGNSENRSNKCQAFFRGGMTALGILSLAKMSTHKKPKLDPDEDSGCSESCEAFLFEEI